MAITIHNRHRILGREWWTTGWAGLSTDDKTTIEDVKVNDLFFEEDTGDFYYCESQGSKGGSEKVFDDTITEWQQSSSLYVSSIDVAFELPETIKVVFDGDEYTVSKILTESNHEFCYGGYVDGDFDFSDIPFTIVNDFYSGGWGSYLYVGTAAEHTVQIYTMSSDTPAVWKKVGSGASSQVLGE